MQLVPRQLNSYNCYLPIPYLSAAGGGLVCISKREGWSQFKQNDIKALESCIVLSFCRIETAEDFRRTLEKIPDYKIRPETVSLKSQFSEKPSRINGLSSKIIIVWCHCKDYEYCFIRGLPFTPVCGQ